MSRPTPLVQHWREVNDVPRPDAATKTVARRQTMRRAGHNYGVFRHGKPVRRWTARRKPMSRRKVLGEFLFAVGAMAITAWCMALAV